MVFDPDIPQPKNDLSVSQADLLGNFQGLNTQFAINHVAFDDTGGDAGKHKFVTFVQQSEVPNTKADEQVIFSQDDGGTPELFVRPESNAPAYQLTKAGVIYGGLLPVVAVNFNNTAVIQGTALNVSPGGVTNPSAGEYTVTFTTSLPDANYFWSVSGFDNSTTNPTISSVLTSTTSSAVIKVGSIKVQFVNQNNTKISGLTRACVICWRIQ